MRCPECDTDVLHCHGVVIVHVTGEVECTEVGCTGRLDVHAWLVPCDEVEGGCRCHDHGDELDHGGARVEVRTAA